MNKDRDHIQKQVEAFLLPAIANKATEEGGLPELPQEIEVGGEGWDFEDFKSQKTFSVDHMHEYARLAIAADRASRQVANKAEVDDGMFSKEWKAGYSVAFEAAKKLFATAPATTGASTSSSTDSEKLIELAEAFAFELSCEDHSNSKLEKTKADLVDYVYSVRNFCADKVRNDALEEAASMLLGGSFLHDKAPSKILAEQAAKAIRALKGSVGASTVLTDERISALWLQSERHYDFARAIEREVAAQADQVAVPGWISVDERLPDDDCQVLAATWFTMTHNQHQDIVSFRRGTGKFSHSDVTHWMPLPPSPAKESK